MSSGSGSPEAKRTFASAARFVVIVVVVALIVFGLSLWWVNGCKSTGANDVLAHCGSVQRYTLALGSPLALLLGGIWAFVQTIRVWKRSGRWWIWQGAGWFLLVFMLVMLRMSTPAALL